MKKTTSKLEHKFNEDKSALLINKEVVREQFSDGLHKYIDKRKETEHFTREILADEWGIATSTLDTWLGKTSFPDMDKLIAICDTIGYDIDALLGRIDSKSHNDAFIREQTGLSIESLDCLKEVYRTSEHNKDAGNNHGIPNREKTLLDTINILLSNRALLESIGNYLFNDDIKRVNVTGKRISITKSDKNENFNITDISRFIVNETLIEESFIDEVHLKDIQKLLDRIREDKKTQPTE